MDTRDIDDDTHLVADLGFDSVMYPIAAVAIEERLGLVLTVDHLQDCSTFGDVVALLAKIQRAGLMHE